MFTVCSTIAQGVFALFGFSNESTRSAIDAFTRAFHMPYVTPSSPINDTMLRPVDTAGYTVYLRPLFDRAMVDIIRQYRWQNISYVYDTNDGKKPRNK